MAKFSILVLLLFFGVDAVQVLCKFSVAYNIVSRHPVK